MFIKFAESVYQTPVITRMGANALPYTLRCKGTVDIHRKELCASRQHPLSLFPRLGPSELFSQLLYLSHILWANPATYHSQFG